MITINKTRTEQNKHNSKWSVWFELWRHRNDERYITAECGSAPVFDTAEEAWAAGDRAMEAFNATGVFPNMCEKF